MGKSLCLIVPSRGRPTNVQRLTEAVEQTSLGEAQLVVGIDDNDPKRAGYVDVPCVKVMLAGHPTMIDKLNSIATYEAQAYEFIGFAGDDHVPRTKGWDKAIIEALDRLPGPGIVYCNDLFQGPNLPTSVFMHSSIVLALGWMAPPTLQHLYCDNAWKALGEALGSIRYLPDVVIEHVHPHAGKAESDEQYERVNSGERYAADQAAFDHWFEYELAMNVDTIRRYDG